MNCHRECGLMKEKWNEIGKEDKSRYNIEGEKNQYSHCGTSDKKNSTKKKNRVEDRTIACLWCWSHINVDWECASVRVCACLCNETLYKTLSLRLCECVRVYVCVRVVWFSSFRTDANGYGICLYDVYSIRTLYITFNAVSILRLVHCLFQYIFCSLSLSIYMLQCYAVLIVRFNRLTFFDCFFLSLERSTTNGRTTAKWSRNRE